MQHYTSSVMDTFGNAVAGATINVYAAGTTTPSTIYSTNAGATTSNPLTSGADGSFDFYAANGRYDLVITHPSHTFTDSDTAGIALFELSGYTSTKAAATGYTRLTPNFCVATTTAQANWVANTAFPPTGQFIDSNLANGVYVVLRLQYKTLSGNGVAYRGCNTLFYTNSGGGTQFTESKFGAYEHVGVVAGTILAEGEDTIVLPVSNSGYVYATDSVVEANGNSFIDKVNILGYYD